MQRREFVVRATGAGAALSIFPAGLSGLEREKGPGGLERRALGKTGEKLSVIGFGGIVVMNATTEDMQASSDGPDVNSMTLLGQASGGDVMARNDRRNVAAVTLSRLGASKGGRARAAVLSAEERRAIAKKAAVARWAKKQRPDSPDGHSLGK